MLKKLTGYFRFMRTEFPKKEDYSIFENHRVDANIKRIHACLIVAFIISIVQVAIDCLYFNRFKGDNIVFSYLWVVHTVMTLIALLWIIFYRSFALNKKLYIKKVTSYIFTLLILSWCVCMALINLLLSGQISAFIIIVFLSSVALYSTPIETVLIYFLSITEFYIGIVNMTFSLPEKGTLISAAVTVLLAAAISRINYSAFLKSYINEKKLLENNLKLQQMENYRTDFFTNISHELRTPLNIIQAAHKMIAVSLDKDNYENDNVSRYLKMVKQNSNRLTRLVNNLIDITKIDSASFEVRIINADIVKVVEDITLSVADYIENKGIDLIFDTDIEEKFIACDPDNIERVMLNLLSNAVKFTDRGGCIYVTLSREDGCMNISVEDTGEGIPKDMLDNIFNRFTQVDNSISRKNEGSGIGLSLVKSIVEMQSGTIDVASELGKGSRFTVKLPDRLADNMENKPQISNVQSSVEKINVEFADIYEI